MIVSSLYDYFCILYVVLAYSLYFPTMSDQEPSDVNEIYSINDEEYLAFIKEHEAQLNINRIPQQFWKSLCLKLKHEVFDAGNAFLMVSVDNEDLITSGNPSIKVVGSRDMIDPNDGNNIFLIDHAWTFKANEAKTHLREIPGLVNRMAKLMNICLQSENLVDKVYDELWKFNQTYSCSGPTSIENRLPVWYVMDEFGSLIQHSDDPNVRVVPFLNIPQGLAYSVLFPIKMVQKAEEVTRDFVEGYSEESERTVQLIPWLSRSMKHVDFAQSEPSEQYFLSGRLNETLPNLTYLASADTNGTMSNSKPLNVYSQYSYVNEYLTSSKFAIVPNEEDADILWLTSHFKTFKEFSEVSPRKYVNQFPFENILTIKDLLAIVCRRDIYDNDPARISTHLTYETYPSWLPTTYNLKTELPQFVSYFQHRQDEGLDNYWICKPWNLARSMDTLITDNLNCLIRLSSSGPKIAQKYVERPVLFYREGVGLVKFDVRYVILLKSVCPLEVYIYKNFFLRFANKPFELSDFDDYEKHFTVMNYNDNTPLHRLLCADFITEFDCQNPDNKWSDVENKIFSMFNRLFKCATMKSPPCGLGHNPQSRALYATDIMLQKNINGEFEPKLLEINWTPDCQRACEYYPDFYNDIFELLFLDEERDVFYRLA